MVKQLSLIVPFYNENEICQNYQELTTYLKKHFLNYELILVSDGSQSSLVSSLKTEIQGDSRTKLIHYPQNQGRGHAVKQGFKQAEGEYLAFIDGDLEIKPIYLKKMIKLLKKYDVVIASKFLPQSQVSSPLFRRLASRLFNLIVRLGLGSKVVDHQTGLKIFRCQVIDSILPRIKEKRWLFDVELLYLIQKEGYSIKEVPIAISYGFGKIGKSLFNDFSKLLMAIFLIRWRHEKKS